MSKYRSVTEALESSVAHLVIDYFRDPDGNERFDWKVEGKLPSLTTVGALTRVQFELTTRVSDECELVQLILIWNGTSYSWFVHPSIPRDTLVGMMEKVKIQILGSLMVNDAKKARPGVLGLDGRPFRG